MFDKDLYVETFSTLHASKNTLTEIQKSHSEVLEGQNISPAMPLY